MQSDLRLPEKDGSFEMLPSARVLFSSQKSTPRVLGLEEGSPG